jgi:hypothetical protein
MSPDTPTSANLGWRKAKLSLGNGQCVEVAPSNGMIVVRDSKDPAGPTLMYPTDQFAVFLNAAKNGEFDDLI